MTKLDELLGTYFDAGHSEGAGSRTHDTVNGLAQRTLSGIREHVRLMVAAETEACAKMLEMKNDELRLLAGEINPDEMLTVQAVMANRAVVIRRRVPAAPEQESAPTPGM